MRVAVLSDTHGNFPRLSSLLDQEIDLLLVVGDIAGGSHHTNAQYKSMGKFIKWIKEINPKQCFITPGNHDYWKWNDLFAYRQGPKNIHCMIDSCRDFEGLMVHATPWSLPFMDWNYMKHEEQLVRHWEHINDSTTILMNHGPVYGICDSVLVPRETDHSAYQHLGSKTLYDELMNRDIPYVFTGHIHSAEHKLSLLHKYKITQCACVSILNEYYKYAYEPHIIEFN